MPHEMPMKRPSKTGFEVFVFHLKASFDLVQTLSILQSFLAKALQSGGQSDPSRMKDTGGEADFDAAVFCDMYQETVPLSALTQAAKALTQLADQASSQSPTDPR